LNRFIEYLLPVSTVTPYGTYVKFCGGSDIAILNDSNKFVGVVPRVPTPYLSGASQCWRGEALRQIVY